MPNTQFIRRVLFLAGTFTLLGLGICPALSAEQNEQTAVFAEGCFWDVEALFRHVKGVTEVESGYAGGAADTARYDLVSKGGTGHAEAVRIHFNPDQVAYQELVRVFFSVVHDPARQGRPGTDAAGQYRSTIFFSNPEQQKIVQDYMQQLADPGVTQLVPLQAFYRAEDYHQNRMERNGFLPYGSAREVPRIKRLQLVAPDLYQ